MRVYNFSAGPANLPLEVLEKAQKELVDYGQAGMSVMEMSHRSADFKAIMEDAKALLRKLMNIPDNYKILFLQGGASLQFAMVPLNLKKNGKADFINTGAWSKKAIKESKKVLDVNVIASSEDKTFSYIPEIDETKLQKDADFLHITQNNTIYGTRYTKLPDTGSVPVVADMSSCILSEEFDVTKYGIIYAGAQKNVGPAGVTIVIIREDLIGNAAESVPTMLNYETHSEADSMFNTPPTFAIYIAKLVFEWLDKNGGVKAMQKINEEKAKMLYDYIDSSKMFSNPVTPKDRSMMNVTFVTGNEDLDAKFVKEAKAQGLCNLKGHRSVGGMRASIYNAMPKAGVEKLIAFMKEFEANN